MDKTSGTSIGLPRPKSRFSLLTLDEGEIYIEDHAAIYQLPERGGSGSSFFSRFRSSTSLKGRLYMCSKSLMFDPQDLSYPIYKLYYKDLKKIGRGSSGTSFAIQTGRYTELKGGNKNRPYVTRESDPMTSPLHIFELVYANDLQPFLGRLSELHKLSVGATRFQLDAFAESLEKAREAQLVFDPSWLVNLSEVPLLNLAADRVQPLVENPGRLVLTSSRIYFQALFRVDAAPVERYELSQVKEVAKRRYLLCQRGIELFFKEGNSVFFALRSRAEMDQFYNVLMSQNLPSLTELKKEDDRSLAEMTEKWRRREVDNFDYLMYLNRRAGRSFNDVTQYPVYPWVIADYNSSKLDLTDPKTFRDLSKPIGALNGNRLEKILKRYHEMSEPKFMYGTHYSTPGYVIFYLVRYAPEYMLRLQNGKFDIPDRLFYSVADTWANVLTNPADLKELIPEFYSAPSFLVNSEELDFGSLSGGSLLTSSGSSGAGISGSGSGGNSGKKVDNVVLPPWAEGSPEKFVKAMREALESDFVSSHLNEWIDLIFGYKQRGSEAIKANNLFYYLTYEGAVDIEKVKDVDERKSYEAQIREFGQCPSQLFKLPHPVRYTAEQLKKINTSEVSQITNSSITNSSFGKPAFSQQSSSSSINTHSSFSSSSSSNESNLSVKSNANLSEREILPRKPGRYNQFYGMKMHRESISACLLSKDSNTLYTVSQDATFRAYSLSSKRQLRMNSFNLALSSCQLSSDEKVLAIGSWDNMIYIYNMDFGRVSDTLCGHDDAVSCLRLSSDKLLSGSWDASVKLWQLRPGGGITKTPLSVLLEGDSAIHSLALVPDDPNVAVAGTADGGLALFDLRERACVAMAQAHDYEVNSVACATLGSGVPAVITCSNDGHIKMWDRRRIAESCVADATGFTGDPRSVVTDGMTALIGSNEGVVEVWDLTKKDPMFVGELPQKGSADETEEVPEIMALAMSDLSSVRSQKKVTVVAGDSTGYVSCWNAEL